MIQIFKELKVLIEKYRPESFELSEEELVVELTRLGVYFKKDSTNLKSGRIYTDYSFDKDGRGLDRFVPEDMKIDYRCLMLCNNKLFLLDLREYEDFRGDWRGKWPSRNYFQLKEDSLIYLPYLSNSSGSSHIWLKGLFANSQVAVPLSQGVKIVDTSHIIGEPMKYLLLESEFQEFKKLFV